MYRINRFNKLMENYTMKLNLSFLKFKCEAKYLLWLLLVWLVINILVLMLG